MDLSRGTRYAYPHPKGGTPTLVHKGGVHKGGVHKGGVIGERSSPTY